ncbi:MAG TPA: DUF2867 domain-containing protein [Solirubrobacteraceae bacterium]|jgi:hypothetical protein|nr:DUF2867 domain-containing protein [Solirubrobacteraceae bacterium]
MRLSNSEHESHPWVMAEIAPDFRLEDAWALPAQGGADDFATLIEVLTGFDPTKAESRAVRALFALRYRIGGLVGWDHVREPLAIPQSSDTSLSARLPPDLRGSAAGVGLASDFVPLYRTDVEWAAEISNGTVHGVLQLAWVEQGDGLYRGRMGVYVKPRGKLGAAYMLAITPFRHLIVYPALMRQIGRSWSARMARQPRDG